MANIPHEFQIYLIDQSKNTYVNLREVTQYNYIPPFKVSSFEVIVGSEQEVIEIIKENTKPTELEIPGDDISAEKLHWKSSEKR